MNNELDEYLERVSPENRERFLKSRLGLEQRFDGNDELISLALHMDNFAAVIGDLTRGIVPRSDNATELAATRLTMKDMSDAVKTLGRDLKEIQLTATVLMNVSKFHLWCIIVGSFIGGAVMMLFICLVCDHFKLL